MRIIKYKEFIRESNNYDFGCIMIEFPVTNWNEIISSIDESDLYEEEGEEYGIQKNPHLTLLYGLESNVSKEQVEDILNGVMQGSKPIEIELENINLFENEDYDVVKFNVKKTELLQKLFDSLSTLPNQNTFKDYQPHITIAYVKKGLGKKYIRNYKHKFISNNICYSKSNGEKIYFEI
jgi:2'-5' RNA ligase